MVWPLVLILEKKDMHLGWEPLNMLSDRGTERQRRKKKPLVIIEICGSVFVYEEINKDRSYATPGLIKSGMNKGNM